MKRFIIFIAVAVFFLVIVGAIVVKVLSPSDSSSTPPPITQDPFADISPNVQTIYTDTPYRAALTCFQWYAHVFANQANANLIAERPEAAQCFTQDFLSQWESLIDSTGSDPVLLAQDFAASWDSSVVVTPVGQSVNTTDEQIILGAGAEQKTVIAHLVRVEDGSWKIQSISE